MGRGRKPEPTSLKILKGIRKIDRVNYLEPVPPEAVMSPPEWLDEVATQKWHELAPVLKSMGVLTQADLEAVTLYCDTYSRWYAERHSAEPNVNALDKLQTFMLRILTEFGFTPSSRSKVRVTQQPKDEIASILDA